MSALSSEEKRALRDWAKRECHGEAVWKDQLRCAWFHDQWPKVSEEDRAILLALRDTSRFGLKGLWDLETEDLEA